MPPAANPLVVATAEPAILEARGWSTGYDGRHGPALDLSQAAPPHAPDERLLARIAEAAAANTTAQYGAVRGEEALKAAYAQHLQQLYGGALDTDEITITAGCNQAFLVSAITLFQAGDGVLLPAPCYFNHQMTLDMLGIRAIALPCQADAGYLPDVDLAESLLDDRVRAIVLVTPNNPTGAEYPPALIERFYDLCRRRGIWLILDETYRDFRHDDTVAPHRLARAGWPEGLVGLYSFSKGYAIPGHRLGAITAPSSIGAEILKVQDCVQICAGRPVQIAMTWGLAHLGAWKAERRREVVASAAALRTALDGTDWRIDGLGAYFAYVHHPFRGLASKTVAKIFAREFGVLTLPGSSFGQGQQDHLRISFPKLKEDALEQFSSRLSALSKILSENGDLQRDTMNVKRHSAVRLA